MAYQRRHSARIGRGCHTTQWKTQCPSGEIADNIGIVRRPADESLPPVVGRALLPVRVETGKSARLTLELSSAARLSRRFTQQHPRNELMSDVEVLVSSYERGASSRVQRA